ncbi:hypothetical protein Rhopal_002728-T1 [Rhodotorula paludigena]|uniref:Uncharacterized protein n=1 Tax=Rhodotorula paludigena TaxID=86838 RepID=A0AAV5GGP5_9BASI|nr:hypothetical protein Rhopal_002728-T1 [Rhodotorula paludigena]
MSGIFAGGLAIPAGAEWIEPWYEELLGGVAAGQSPYLMIKHTVYLLYHPTTPAHFDKQLWALVGVFILHVRLKGAFYRQSRAKSAVAVIMPILLPLAAWVPPSVFFVRASSDYNASARIGDDISTDMDNWQKDFVPGQGFDIARLALLFGPGAELGSRLIASTKNAKIGYAYCGAMLLVLFAAHLLGTKPALD